MNDTTSENVTLQIIAHRSVVLLIITVISACCLWQIRSINFSGDVNSYVDGSHREYQSYFAAAERFGHYETYVFVIRAANVLDPGVMQIIESISESLDDDLDIFRVFSLTNLPLELLTDALDDSFATPASHERLLDNPYMREHFLSSDSRQTQIYVLVDSSEVNEGARLNLAARLKLKAASETTDAVRIDVTGPSVVAIEAMEITQREFKRFVWLVPLLLSAVVLVVFQGHPLVFAPVIIVLLSTLWTIGLFTAAGNSVTMLTAMIPVVISVITFADVIHILHKYYCNSESGENKKTIVLRTMTPMNIACFMTSLTTAIGFIALFSVSSITVVSLFTFWAAVGVMLSYFLTITLMPIGLMQLRLPTEDARRRYRFSVINRLMVALHRFALRPRPGMMLTWFLLTLTLLWGSFQSSVQTDISKFLPAETPSIATLQMLKSGSDGIDSLDLVIDLDSGTFRQADPIILLKKLEEGLSREFDEIRSIQSLTGAVSALYHDDGHVGFPDRPDDIEEYLLLMELSADEAWLRSFSTDDFSGARVSLRIAHEDSRTTTALIDRIDSWLVDNAPAGWHIETTGVLKLLVSSVQSLLESQLQSFLLALLAITLVIFFFVRDWVLSVLALIVNVIPVLAGLGFISVLVWTRLLPPESTSLNISTVMVPSLAMAIAVDDTIHFLYRYRTARVAGASVHDAVREALTGAGFAMTVTTIAMVLGFSVLFFSAMRANQEFAAMMCIALTVALLAELILLPQLIKSWMPNRHA